MFDNVEQAAAFEQPQYEPQLLFNHEAGVVGDDVLVVAAGHGLDLLEELVHGRVPLLEVDALDGALLVARAAVGGVHYGGGADADDVQELVVVLAVGPRVPGARHCYCLMYLHLVI